MEKGGDEMERLKSLGEGIKKGFLEMLKSPEFQHKEGCSQPDLKYYDTVGSGPFGAGVDVYRCPECGEKKTVARIFG